jgi:hypothetical protein
MSIPIPLFSTALLAAAFMIALGVALVPLSARLGIIFIGAGSIIMGLVVLADLPKGFELQGIILFGLVIIVGAWMIAVGLKRPARRDR